MLAANVCYLLGAGGEILVPEEFVERYRAIAYGLGLAIAVTIPVGSTVLFVLMVMTKVH